MNKTLTMSETIEALLRGEKLGHKQWAIHNFIHIVDNFIMDESGFRLSVTNSKGYFIYQEPKKMIKVAPYVFRYEGSRSFEMSENLYVDDRDFEEGSDSITFYKRLTALEIEVPE